MDGDYDLVACAGALAVSIGLGYLFGYGCGWLTFGVLLIVVALVFAYLHNRRPRSKR